MKILKRVGMDLAEIEEMLDEAILLSRIGHPNIVRVFDANLLETPAGICGYFTMENVSGGSLDRFWRSHGASLVPIETTIDIIKQVCRGLAVAHAEDPPIIHRDIKPQNILVGYEADGLRARISDFGLAKKVNPLTLLATAAGTLAFKPPEAFGKAKGDSCAADVWALGTTLYLLLTDTLPYEVDPELGWGNYQAFKEEIVRPSEFNIDVDKHLESIILRCLEPKSTARYKNAKQLLEALEKWKPVDSKVNSLQHSSSMPSKTILGIHSTPDQEEGRKLVKEAINKARNEGQLNEAADMMEEAFNKSPSLRQKYASQVKLWRCGVSM
jgi:serine/threonine-protein kinase